MPPKLSKIIALGNKRILKMHANGEFGRTGMYAASPVAKIMMTTTSCVSCLNAVDGSVSCFNTAAQCRQSGGTVIITP